jgi:hypothetical protein
MDYLPHWCPRCVLLLSRCVFCGGFSQRTLFPTMAAVERKVRLSAGGEYLPTAFNRIPSFDGSVWHCLLRTPSITRPHLLPRTRSPPFFSSRRGVLQQKRAGMISRRYTTPCPRANIDFWICVLFPSTSFQAFGEINAAVPATGTPKGKTTQYQKLTQLEHVLVRPDTYIGAVERTEDTMVVFDGDDIGFRTREVS